MLNRFKKEYRAGSEAWRKDNSFRKFLRDKWTYLKSQHMHDMPVGKSLKAYMTRKGIPTE